MFSTTSKVSLRVIQGSKKDLSQQIFEILEKELPAPQTMALLKQLLLQNRKSANTSLSLITSVSSN